MNIASMRIIHDAEPSPTAGNILLASFDIVVGPLLVQGCAIVRRPQRGDVVVAMPSRRDGARKFGVFILEKDVRGEITECALTAYEAMIGQAVGAA